MDILVVPLFLYNSASEQSGRHANLIARIYNMANKLDYEFASISHCHGLCRALLSPEHPPKSLPNSIIRPLGKLLVRQLEDIIEKKGEGIDKAYLFIRQDAGHYVLREALLYALEQKNIPCKVYTPSEWSDKVAIE